MAESDAGSSDRASQDGDEFSLALSPRGAHFAKLKSLHHRRGTGFEPSGISNAEWESVQKKTITRWMNTFLKQRNVRLENFDQDLRDGVILIHFAEIITGKKVQTFNVTPKQRIHRIENINAALQLLKEVKLINVGAEDIEEGNVKVTLGLMWSLISHFQLKRRIPDDESSQQAQDLRKEMLHFVNSRTQKFGVTVNNFSSSFRDGKALAALTNLLADSDDEDGERIDISALEDPLEDTEKAMAIAESRYAIPRMLDPEDLVTAPDPKSVLTYVSYFQQRLEEKEAIDRELSKPDSQVPYAKKCQAEGEGVRKRKRRIRFANEFTVHLFNKAGAPIEHWSDDEDDAAEHEADGEEAEKSKSRAFKAPMMVKATLTKVKKRPVRFAGEGMLAEEVHEDDVGEAQASPEWSEAGGAGGVAYAGGRTGERVLVESGRAAPEPLQALEVEVSEDWHEEKRSHRGRSTSVELVRQLQAEQSYVEEMDGQSVVVCDVDTKEDGSFKVSYAVPEVGEWMLQVTVNGKKMPAKNLPNGGRVVGVATQAEEDLEDIEESHEDETRPMLARSRSEPMLLVPKVDVATNTVLDGRNLDAGLEELERMRAETERLRNEFEAKEKELVHLRDEYGEIKRRMKDRTLPEIEEDAARWMEEAKALRQSESELKGVVSKMFEQLEKQKKLADMLTARGSSEGNAFAKLKQQLQAEKHAHEETKRKLLELQCEREAHQKSHLVASMKQQLREAHDDEKKRSEQIEAHRRRVKATREELRRVKAEMGEEIKLLKAELAANQRELSDLRGKTKEREELIQSSMELLAQLQPWVGIEIPILAPEDKRRDEPGVTVAAVKSGGPAKLAGFEKGDVIEACEDEETNDNAELRRIVESALPGDRLTFQINRGGTMLYLHVEVSSKALSFKHITDLRRIAAGITKPGDDKFVARVALEVKRGGRGLTRSQESSTNLLGGSPTPTGSDGKSRSSRSVVRALERQSSVRSRSPSPASPASPAGHVASLSSNSSKRDSGSSVSVLRKSPAVQATRGGLLSRRKQ